MPTDPRETLQRRRAERQRDLERGKDEAVRLTPAVALRVAWDDLTGCTLGTLGLTDSPDDRPRFYAGFAARMIRVGALLQAQGRLAELAKLEGQDTALDHAINLMAAAANGTSVEELAGLLQETAEDGEFINHVGLLLRYDLRDVLLTPGADRGQSSGGPAQRTAEVGTIADSTSKCGHAVQRDAKAEARDQWLYAQAKKKHPPTWRSLMLQLNKVADKRGWRKLSSPQAVEQAVDRYVRRHCLEPLPPRKEG